MTTKFSTRPAPRKRPWICKRSPPCLIPPPFPPSLLASFIIQKIKPPPRGSAWSGSLILTWLPIPAIYKGSLLEGADSYTCTFTYDHATSTGHAYTEWTVFPFLDWGTDATKQILLPPSLNYYDESVTTGFDTWHATLSITS